jgi:two-component system heavy metal sensor histidine kinase CusS
VQQWRKGGENYRVLAQQSGGHTIITAVATDFHLHFLHQFHRTLWLMIAGAIVAMALMGWIAVRQGHRPLHRIVGQIGQIGASALNTRLAAQDLPPELVGLARSFNALLQRLEESFARLSNFSADIAHELRTPVTNLMTQTQVTLAQPRSVAEYQEILYSSMEEYERMAQMVGDMLFLAQADNGRSPPNAAEVDLEREVRNLFDYYEAWAEERQVTLLVAGNAHLHGDRLMLRRALGNLIANAIRHTPAGRCVTVQLSRSGDEVMIAVCNPGSPIAPEHLPHLFDRFYRIDPARQRSGEGAGLGLAIVRSIVELHGGRVAAASDEHGTAFRITLPNAKPDTSPEAKPAAADFRP